MKSHDLVYKNVDVFNVFTGHMDHGDLAVDKGVIVGLGDYQGRKELDGTGRTIVPGFIDGHIHLESSMLTPDRFAEAVAPHGTCAVITDPHEIANVCGTAGIDYMLEATTDLPIDVYFMVPSCVPASPFDENGYTIAADQIRDYMSNARVLGLAEMMNYPGVLASDPETMSKIAVAHAAGKLVDGHAPGLTGEDLRQYVAAGIYSDHECTTAEEALEKLGMGQWIMVREGTAGKNLQALLPLCQEPYFHRCMFATDDKHPDDLINTGHIDYIIRRAIELGVRPQVAYQMATINAATYFKLAGYGAVAPGYRANFVVLRDFKTVDVEVVYKDGVPVAEINCSGTAAASSICDTMRLKPVTAADFAIDGSAKVIGLVPGEVLTTDEGWADGVDVAADVLKLAVVERHHETGHIGRCYVKGYGLKSGAVATSVAHDSHNVICVGTNDDDMATAVMALRDMRGGLVIVDGGRVVASMALSIAGLMCDLPVVQATEALEAVRGAAHSLGVREDIDPFMTLSFASLPVIPALKLTTLGVVDVVAFKLLD